MTIYAAFGETVTCENGHAICDLARTVSFGDIQNPPEDLCNWRQAIPEVGQLPLPVCAVCKAPFYDGMRFHFADGWRSRGPVRAAAEQRLIAYFRSLGWKTARRKEGGYRARDKEPGETFAESGSGDIAYKDVNLTELAKYLDGDLQIETKDNPND